MPQTEYRTAIDLLRRAGIELMTSVPATQADVAALGDRLGFDLPPSYVAMLMEFGCLAFEGREFYGWTRSGLDGAGIPNVVFATEYERRSGAVPITMLVIASGGDGSLLVLDGENRGEDGEAAVYEIDEGGAANGRTRRANSFGDFLLEEAGRALEET